MKLIFNLETELVGFRDPDIHMLNSEKFNKLWNVLKTWDLGKPIVQQSIVDGVHTEKHTHLYSGTTGTDIRHILDLLNPQKKL